ncbi:MAG TPA: hypothetical protein VFX59_02980 [Polyangiales bacterium]|nr:hypothetical protein [Polyangiales bacterium]
MVGKLNSITPSIAPQPVMSSRPPPPVAAADEAAADSAASIKLSGRAMMLSRLFRTTDPRAEPAVASEVKPNTEDVYPYLQKEDRALLAKAYDFATEKGIDPSNVDAVARDIAVHRSSSPSLEVLEAGEGVPAAGDEKKVELARAVTAYRTTPGSPLDRERFANTTSRILQDHLSGGGKVDFEFVRRLLTQPAEGSSDK